MNNITDFINEIQRLGVHTDFENYFRGHPDQDYKLLPSIYRDRLIENEHKIFKESISRVPNEFINSKTTIEKLVKMQHYGIPTRLLDITSNPLVALYFACCKDYRKDGEVVFLRVPEDHIKYYDSDTVSVISNIAKRSEYFEIDTSINNIKEFNSSYHIGYLLNEIREEKPYFQSIIDPKHFKEVYVVKVKLDNERILKQHGAFLIFGIGNNKIYPTIIPYDWVINKNTPVKLTVPSSRKKPLLKELEAIGISNRTLFPELENQGIYLKKKYKKAPN